MICFSDFLDWVNETLRNKAVYHGGFVHMVFHMARHACLSLAKLVGDERGGEDRFFLNKERIS